MAVRESCSWGAIVPCLLVVVLAAGLPAPARAIDVSDLRAQQVVTVRCDFSHRAADDPIMLPGQPGASHLHDFFGSRVTNASSTYEQMLEGGTTCDRSGDTAAYWMPSLLVDDVPVQPLVATIYYRSFAEDPADVVAHPADFRMIGGDPTATSPQGTKRVAWGCRAEGKKDTWVAEIPDCRGDDGLVFRVDFPECWDGVHLDSPDHRSHVAYQRADGSCPPTHPVSVPEVAMTVDYPPLPQSGRLSMSTGGEFNGHADFWNTWDQEAYLEVVAGCLHASRWCRNSGGPRGGRAPEVEPTQPIRDDGLTCSLAPPGGWVPLRARGAVSQAAAMSDDGTVVAYELQRAARGRSDIAVVAEGVTEVLRAPTGGRLFNPAVSGDGRWVVVRATADLLPQDDNGQGDIYAHDRATGAWTLLSRGVDGSAANGPSFDPAVSRDGRWVAFDSRASNLVDGDTNGRADVFLLDRDADGDGVLDEPGTSSMEVVSLAMDGGPADRGSWNPALSDDGRIVAFVSAASNLTEQPWNKKQHVFVRDRLTGQTVQASASQFRGVPANSASGSPEVSGDGSTVVFESSANNMVPRDNGMMDVFAYTTADHELAQVSRELRRYPSGRSAAPAISDDGRWVVYASEANALVVGDTNVTQDVFLADLLTGTTTRVSVARDGAEIVTAAAFPAISGDGGTIAIESADALLGTRGDQSVLVGPRPSAC